MSAPQRFGPFDVDEDTTFKLQTPSGAPIVDENGTPIPGSAVDSCRLTLYDVKTEAVINGREDQDILNANGGTWLSSGEFAILFEPADQVILDDKLAFESHVALVEYGYNTTKKGKMEAVLNVRNMEVVP